MKPAVTSNMSAKRDQCGSSTSRTTVINYTMSHALPVSRRKEVLVLFLGQEGAVGWRGVNVENIMRWLR